MRKILVLAINLLLLSLPSVCFAVHMRSIYQAQIPVVSQDAEVKKKAIEQGLAQVFSKVSGNGHIMNDDPSLKNSMKNADALVQQFSYSAPEVEDKDHPFILTINYEPDTINKILSDANIPVWSQNRPLIIVWIAQQTPTHPLDIIDSASDIDPLFRQTAKAKGLPVIFPLGDIADMGALSAADITAKDFTKIDIASKRYQAEAILTGVIIQNPSDISSHWELKLGDQGSWSWDVTGKSIQDVLTGINDNIATTLAGKFATVETEKVQTIVTLQVRGIEKQKDLLKLMKYLQITASTSDVQIVNVDGSNLTLDVSLDGTKQSLVQTLSTSKLLKPIPGSNSQDDTLLYQWVQ